MADFLIDHVGHADKTRPMNSTRKIGRVQGAMYRMAGVAGRPFGRGLTGEALLSLHKDDMGGLELPKGTVAGKFVMASAAGGTDIKCYVESDSHADLGSLSNFATGQADRAARKETTSCAHLNSLES